MTLDARQVVPLTSDDLDALRGAAETRAITAGLFARALVRYAMARLDDPDLHAVIDAEKTEAKTRVSDGARRAVSQRWGK